MMRSHLDYCLQKEASIYYYTGAQVKSRTRLQLIHSNMKPNFSSISTRMPVRLDPSSNISTDRLCLAVLLAWRLPPCGGEHGLRPESFLLHRREPAAMSMEVVRCSLPTVRAALQLQVPPTPPPLSPLYNHPIQPEEKGLVLSIRPWFYPRRRSWKRARRNSMWAKQSRKTG